MLHKIGYMILSALMTITHKFEVMEEKSNFDGSVPLPAIMNQICKELPLLLQPKELDLDFFLYVSH